MSDLSEAIEADRAKRPARTGRKTRNDKTTARRGQSQPGGVTASCGCRFVRTGGYWYHVTPCTVDDLREWPVSDENMIVLGAAA